MILAVSVIEQPWRSLAFTDAAGRNWLPRGAELQCLASTPAQSFPDQQ